MAGTPPTPTIVAVNDGDLLTANTLNSFTQNISNLFNYTQAGFYRQKPLYFSRLSSALGQSQQHQPDSQLVDAGDRQFRVLVQWFPDSHHHPEGRVVAPDAADEVGHQRHRGSLPTGFA